MSVALVPSRLCHTAQPVGTHRCKRVERRPEGLGHQLEEVQIARDTKSVGALDALLTTGVDEAARLEPLEHGVEQKPGRIACNKASAELAQHAEVEARVRQLDDTAAT